MPPHPGTPKAIASRDRAKADAAAAKLSIPTAHESYEALLADPNIDAVYIPLPNHLHAPWTIRAAEAGKHVLCEKPIALNAAEARHLVEVRDRTGVQIQEAFMVRSHPQWLKAQALVREGEIGDLRSILWHFSYFNAAPSNIRNIAEFGGGGLMDIGCYLINTGRFLFGREPERVMALIDRDPVFRTDRMTSLLLDFGVGHLAGTCSTQLVPYQRVAPTPSSCRSPISTQSRAISSRGRFWTAAPRRCRSRTRSPTWSASTPPSDRSRPDGGKLPSDGLNTSPLRAILRHSPPCRRQECSKRHGLRQKCAIRLS